MGSLQGARFRDSTTVFTYTPVRSRPRRPIENMSTDRAADIISGVSRRGGRIYRRKSGGAPSTWRSGAYVRAHVL